MKNSTKIGMAIIAAASILGAAYVYAFTWPERYLHLGLLLMVSLKKSKWLKDKA